MASATAVALARRYWVEIAWAIFAAANAVVLVVLAEYETIPFHFIWVSFALVYCFRMWSLRATVVATVAVCLVTGLTLGEAVLGSPQGWDELTEVPLMALMFGVIVVHARHRQRAVDDLRLSTERERAFVRDASHQLRTPITIARGHIELIRAEQRGTQSGRDAEVVLDELVRLTDISDRLLALASSLEEDSLTREVVDLEDLLRTTFERWSATVARDWSLTVGASGTLLADESRLICALDALIENAVNATEPTDRISITGSTDGETAAIAVSDAGTGIAPEDVESIFEPFARVRHASRDSGGTGLGLPIVRAIVEAHGGSIDVVSSPGQGTTFRILLGGFRQREPALAQALLEHVAVARVPQRG